MEKAVRMIGYISLLLFIAASCHYVWQWIMDTKNTPYSIIDGIVVFSWYTMAIVAGILLAIDHEKPEDDWHKKSSPIKTIGPYWE